MIAMIVNFQKYHSRKHFPKASFFLSNSRISLFFCLEMIKYSDSFVWLWLLMLNALSWKKGRLTIKRLIRHFSCRHSVSDNFNLFNGIVSAIRKFEFESNHIIKLINNLFLNFYRRNLYLRFQYPIGWQESEEVGCISLELVGPKKENIDDCKETKLS